MRKIILADDRPVIINGVRAYVDLAPNLSIAATATSTDELLGRLKDTKCDVLITDFAMSMRRMCDGFTLLSYVKRNYPDLRLIVLTMNVMPVVLYQIIKSGVNGLLHLYDDLGEIGRAIQGCSRNLRYIGPSVRQILRANPLGRVPSPRETEVLRMYVDGYSAIEIAARLNKSVKTVGLQKASAMRKMGLANDIELGRYLCGGIDPLEACLIDDVPKRDFVAADAGKIVKPSAKSLYLKESPHKRRIR